MAAGRASDQNSLFVQVKVGTLVGMSEPLNEEVNNIKLEVTCTLNVPLGT